MKHPQRPTKKSPPPPQSSREATPLEVRAAFAPDSVNDETRTVDLTWTTGASVKRYDWYNERYYIERLRVDDGAVDLSRLQAGAALLSQHNQYSLSGQIGVVERAWIEGGEGHATVRFSKRADVEPIWQDVKDGIIRNVSVGYSQDKVRDTKEDVDGIPVREVTRWTPHELSLVSIPADAGAQVREAPDDHAPLAHEENMDEDNTPETARATPPSPAPAPTVNVDAERAAAITQERQRVSDITEAVRQGGQSLDLASELIASGASVSEARAAVLRKIGERNPPIPGPVVEPGNGRREAEFRALAVEGLAFAADGVRKAPESSEARVIAAGGLHEFMRTYLGMHGKSSHGLVKGQLVRAAMETGDFVHVIAAVAEKSLLNGYAEESRKFTSVFRPARARNFKNVERVRLSDYPELQTVAEGDAYVEAAIGENKETYTVLKYGRSIGYTWEMMVNEDLDMIGRIPQLMGASAARKENDVVWGKLMTPGNLADGDAVFNVTDENESNVDLDAAGLRVARKYFHTRTAENGQKLELDPAFLVVGPDLIDTAELLLASYPEHAFPDRTLSVSAALRQQLTLVMSARVTGENWFVLGNTNQIDTMEYAYLDGYERPTITRENSFSIDKIDLKIRHVFGAGWVDRRGAWHSDSTP